MTRRANKINPRHLGAVVVVVAVFLALGFIAWINGKRAQRVLQVSATPQWSVDAPVVDATSPTGYAGGRRWLIVPGHNNESYQWIAQTQQMLASGDWRIRRVDYENAPLGRDVTAASPYRWWLGLMAWCDHVASGRPLGQAVERAALFSDPVLHGLLVISVAAFVLGTFGTLPAVLVSFGLAAIFPFSASFAAGIPSHLGLALAGALWSLLFLAAGLTVVPPADDESAPREAGGSRRMRRFFILSGLAGGFGLWISVGIQLPVLVGTLAGALIAAAVNRGDASRKLVAGSAVPPWRAWACSGAAASLLGYLAEYFPGHLTMQLEVNHPLYALGWLGAGELLVRAIAWIQGAKRGWTWRDGAVAALAVIAIAAIPITATIQRSDFFAQERQLAPRLSVASDVTAKNFAEWISVGGLAPPLWATVLSLAIVAVGAALVRRSGAHRATIALGLGPLLVTIIFAWRNLWWWNVVDVILLALLAVITRATAESTKLPRLKWIWSGLLAGVFCASGFQVVPRQNAAKPNALDYSEGESYIERDLAHWLAVHSGAAIPLVLAPPNLTTTFCFHGGLRGLGTLNWENQDGIMGAVRMVSALTAEEAYVLIENRGVTHIVIPSWDSLLDQYARLGMRVAADSDGIKNSFLAALHRWDLPDWLRPIAYKFPANRTGAPSVVILEVVEEQNPAVAMSRLAEYFVEMERLDLATAAAQNLGRFPGDVGALVALGVVETIRGDKASATGVVARLLPLLALDERRPLPFDRRVSLTILLAQYKQVDLARRQFDLCLAEIDEPRLRSLSTVSLYRFELLAKLFGRSISDPKLHALARELLPPDLRSRL